MNFSVIIPSRNRIPQLKQLIKTIVDKTSDISQTEIIVTVDTDDPSLEQYTELMNSHPHPKQFIVQEHNDNLNDGYYNMMARRARGRFVVAVNDDCVFGTQGWDSIIIEEVSRRGLDNKVVFLKTGGNGVAYHEGSYPPFPGLSREAIKALGWFHWPGIWTWDADEVLWNIFHGLKNMHAIDRIVIVIGVEIQHLNNENYKYSPVSDEHDQSTNNMIKNYGRGDSGKDFHYYNQVVETLYRAIQNEKT